MNELFESCKDICFTWTWPGLELHLTVIDGIYEYSLYDVTNFDVIESGITTVTDILTRVQEIDNTTR
jgi:hypothetical protein